MFYCCVLCHVVRQAVRQVVRIATVFGLNVLLVQSVVASCAVLYWQDEFDADTLNSDFWNIAEGDGCAQDLCGWGNNEKQWYAPDNVQVIDGMLRINARHERHMGREYTSGKITSLNKFSKRFGRFEARMKLPKGRGFWPAFWLMPQEMNQKWPLEGEIDILEAAGSEPQRIIGAAHFGKVWPDNVHYSETLLAPYDWTDDFHIYALEWFPDSLSWFVDNKLYGHVGPEDIAPYEWVFNNEPFYIIFNLALGGSIGGEISNEELPGDLLVDYVRVYADACHSTAH